MLITKEILGHVFPHCRDPEQWVRPLEQAMDEFEINTKMRVAAFLGQIGHESSELNKVVENMIYRARRIHEVWKNRFPTIESAQPYARNPEKLANKVYANRLGNGDEGSGDGFLFRGRGLIQITGRENYDRIGELIGFPNLVQMPNHLQENKYAALSAAAFWADKGLNKKADALTDENFDNGMRFITKKVRGTETTWEDRKDFVVRALEVLPEDPVEEVEESQAA